MRRTIPARAGCVNVVEHGGLRPAGLAVHHVLNVFAVTLGKEREAIKSGNVIPGSFGAERPAQLSGRSLHDQHSLLRLPLAVERYDDGQNDGYANRPHP